VREDRKVDLGLDAAGYQRVGPLTEQVLAMLARTDGQLNMDDESTPDSIRLRFGVSKKAFKQALGRLLRERKIEFTKPGIRLVNK
jgi:predicted RNA-binding protein (virulence factor B family)